MFECYYRFHKVKTQYSNKVTKVTKIIIGPKIKQAVMERK